MLLLHGLFFVKFEFLFTFMYLQVYRTDFLLRTVVEKELEPCTILMICGQEYNF